jgi:L-amino acid N-acyltransferase YncA
VVVFDEATEADLPALLAIFNDVVATSTAIYQDAPASLEERTAWWRARRDGGFPVLVARADDGATIGYASYGPFHERSGYAGTVEHTVMLAAEARGRGLGSALVAALLERAAHEGLHAMIGLVDGENTGSIRMHERLGFVEVGRLPEVGRKFGRWLDLVYLQHRLG